MSRLSAYLSPQEPHGYLSRVSRLDYGFITILLVLAAIPLLTLRGAGWFQHEALAITMAALGLGILVFWLHIYRHAQSHGEASAPERPATVERSRGSFYRIAAIGFLLIIFTILGFYLPLRKDYWHGFDDSGTLLSSTDLSDWSHLDASFNRPFQYLGSIVAVILTPGRIEGFIWLAVIARFSMGVLLYGILRQIFSRMHVLPMIAALLYIVNPSEPLRYMVIALSAYYFLPLVLILAIWLYIYSYRYTKRWLLIGACLLLAMSSLGVESGYPIAVFCPALLWLAVPRKSNFIAWTYAWLGTIGILGIRFVLFLVANPGAYQLRETGQGTKSIAGIAQNLLVQLQPVLSYLTTYTGAKEYAFYGILIFIVLIGLIWLSKPNDIINVKRKAYAVGLIVSAAAIFLGVLAFYGFSGTIRTQFYAAVPQAAFWAIIVALVSSLLPRIIRSLGIVALVGVLVVTSATGSMQAQDQFNLPIRFERILYVTNQVHKLAPSFSPGTLVLFFLGGGQPSPFGANYAAYKDFLISFGVGAAQANYADPLKENVMFDLSGVTWIRGGRPYASYNYSQVVAFLISDWNVILLSQIPASFLPNGIIASGYNPLARIQKGDGMPLPYLQFASWMTRFVPDPDIVNGDIGLGEGWYDIERQKGQPFRWVNNDAEIFSPLLACKRVDLVLKLEPGPSLGSKAFDLKVMNGNQVIAEDTMGSRPQYQMTLAGSVSMASIQLHIDSDNQPVPNDPRILNLRIWNVALVNPFDCPSPTN